MPEAACWRVRTWERRVTPRGSGGFELEPGWDLGELASTGESPLAVGDLMPFSAAADEMSLDGRAGHSKPLVCSL